MTLEDLMKLTTEAALKAHVLIGGTFSKPVKSIAVRVDDDGTSSVILYTDHTDGRITSEETRKKDQIIQAVRQLRKQHPDLADNLTNLDSMYVPETDLWEFLAARGVEIREEDSIWDTLERFFGEPAEADDTPKVDEKPA